MPGQADFNVHLDVTDGERARASSSITRNAEPDVVGVLV